MRLAYAHGVHVSEERAPRRAAGLYRDESAAARRRIEELEADLTARGIALHRPRRLERPPPRRVAKVVAFAVLGALVGATAAWISLLHRPTELAPLVLPPRASRPLVRDPVAPPQPALRWYEPPSRRAVHQGPWVVARPDGDLLIGLAWRGPERDAGLHAVAFDRATLTLRWAQPVPGAWTVGEAPRYQLVVDDDRVVVVDAARAVLVLDVGSGALLLEAPISAKAVSICVGDGSKPQVLLGVGRYAGEPRRSFAPEPEDVRYFEARTMRPSVGPRRDADGLPVCKALAACGGAGETTACKTPPGDAESAIPWALASDALGVQRPADWSTRETWRVGDLRLAVGDTVQTPDIALAVVGYRVGDAAPRWIARPRVDTTPRPWRVAVTTSHLSFAQSVRGFTTVLTFDVDAGALISESTMHGELRGLSAAGADLFVHVADGVDDKLVVVDAASGGQRGTLEAP